MPDVASALSAPPNPFDFAAMAKSTHDSIDAAIGAIPDGHDGAFLLRATTQNGTPALQAMTAAKIGGDWKVAAGVTFAVNEKPSAEILLMDSWSW